MSFGLESSTRKNFAFHGLHGRIAGELMGVDGGGFRAGNVTFVNIYDAG